MLSTLIDLSDSTKSSICKVDITKFNVKKHQIKIWNYGYSETGNAHLGIFQCQFGLLNFA